MRAILAVVVLIAMSATARADGNSGEADNDLEFGAITTFLTERQAQSACGSDTVVWADRYAGYFFFRREDKYGKTTQGAYACLKDAERANYWSSGPMGGIAQGHGSGRVFPDRFPEPMS